MPVDAAIERTQQMLEQAHGVRWVQASILGMLGYLFAMADEPEQARTYEARSRAIYEEHGDDVPARGARRYIAAGIERMAGDLDAAERELRHGHDELEAIGENELRLTIAATLAQVLYEQGRDDEAEVFARASESAAAEDDVGTQVLWRSALAKVLARRDGDAEAEALADEAVRLAATTDMLSLQGAAVLDRARVAALLNGGTAPPELVAEARALFERKGDAASLRRVALEFAGARRPPAAPRWLMPRFRALGARSGVSGPLPAHLLGLAAAQLSRPLRVPGRHRCTPASATA